MWVLFFAFAAVAAEAVTPPPVSPLAHRFFTSGQSLWIKGPRDILLFRQDTRVLKTVPLSDSLADDVVSDAAENSGVLWITAKSGLYQADMTTATLERIPNGPPDMSNARVTADVDFSWVFLRDTLWKFDKLSREWFAFAPGKNVPSGDRLIGTHSDGSRVSVITASGVALFSIADEKWTSYPNAGFSFSPKAEFFPGDQYQTVIDCARIYRYLIDKLAWDAVTVPSDILDVQLSKDNIYILSSQGAFQYSSVTTVLQRFDIPASGGSRSMALMGDTLVLAGPKNIIKYSMSARTSDNVIYPSAFSGIEPVKILSVSNKVFLLYTQALAVYHTEINDWLVSSLLRVKSGGNLFSWDDNGARARYGNGIESQLKGSISQLATFRSKDSIRFDTVIVPDSIGTGRLLLIPKDTQRILYYTPAKFGSGLYADLTLHTNLGNQQRYADLFFVKQAGSLPSKGLFYRGDAGDYLESGKLGTNTYTTPLSQTLPAVQYEGLNVIANSQRKLETRDRHIARVQAGGGLMTSKTVTAILPYNRQGEYNLFDTTMKKYTIVPGSLRITVDGEDIDSTQYSFTALNGYLTIMRRDLLDPTSVIMASYRVQPKPDSGLETVEMLPKNHFGVMEYGSATVSPVDWGSVQAGVTTIKQDSRSVRRTIVNTILPLEFREKRHDLLLKVAPEVSLEGFDSSGAGSAKAVGLSVQSRAGDWTLGKATSFLLNYSANDQGYSATDTLSKGYGKIKNNLNFTVTHDILTQLPVSYTQSNQVSQYGSEQYRKGLVGFHFQNLPFLDISLSQNTLSINDSELTHSDSLADTMRLERNKNKLKFDLYEVSSPALQSLLHLNKFGYEISYTRFTSKKESPALPDTGSGPAKILPDQPGHGDIVFGSATLSPIPSVTVSGQTTYKRNTQDTLVDDTLPLLPQVTRHQIGTEVNPSLVLQTINAPPGIDFNAYYSADYSGTSFTMNDLPERLSRAVVGIQRKFSFIMNPGVWKKSLSFMSPQFGISQNLTCSFDSLDTVPPTAGEIIFGTAGTKSGTTTYSPGLQLFPTDNIQVRLSSDYTTGNSVTNLHLFFDNKWWFGANRLWQVRWEFNHIAGNDIKGIAYGQYINKIFTFYDATWCSWFRSTEQLSANIVIQDTNRIIDSTFNDNAYTYSTVPGTVSTVSLGPQFLATFNLQNVGPIKTLLNSHSIKFSWETAADHHVFNKGLFDLGIFKPGVNFSYNVSLQCIFRPNISAETYHTIDLRHGTLGNYYSYFLVKLLF